ncbi:MAG: hypothetical protein ACTHLP_18805 [Rhizobiaceae bacterium]
MKLIIMLAAVVTIGAATSGCVSEEGYHRAEYRPAVTVHRTRVVHRDHYRDRDHAWRHDRDHRGDHDRGRDRHSSRDHHDRCRPGERHCDRHHM